MLLDDRDLSIHVPNISFSGPFTTLPGTSQPGRSPASRLLQSFAQSQRDPPLLHRRLGRSHVQISRQKDSHAFPAAYPAVRISKVKGQGSSHFQVYTILSLEAR